MLKVRILRIRLQGQPRHLVLLVVHYCCKNCCKIASLTNVGGVKQFSSTRQHVLVEERHFALVEAVAFALPSLAHHPGQSDRS